MSKNTQFTPLKTYNHYLKTILTLKIQFENIFYIFWNFLNLHLNIIIFKN
jgi:hypothetical protein